MGNVGDLLRVPTRFVAALQLRLGAFKNARHEQAGEASVPLLLFVGSSESCLGIRVVQFVCLFPVQLNERGPCGLIVRGS